MTLRLKWEYLPTALELLELFRSVIYVHHYSEITVANRPTTCHLILS